jgi:hypothetical protein
MHWVEILGYCGALLTLGTYGMKRMIPLRVIGMCANCLFITYGFLAPVYPQLVLHGVLLPLNAFRLREMLQLIGKVKAASQGDLNMGSSSPSRRAAQPSAEVLFQGDLSSAIFYGDGRYRLNEIGREIGQASHRRIGLIARTTSGPSPSNASRTESAQHCYGPQAIFQNPTFGFYFLQLISQGCSRILSACNGGPPIRLDCGATPPGRSFGVGG